MTDKEKKKDKYLRYRYGISLIQYYQMLEDQGSACAICKKPASYFKTALAVDHNHASGKVRGLLCYRDNKFLVGRHTMTSVLQLLEYFTKYDKESHAGQKKAKRSRKSDKKDSKRGR